MTISTFCVVFTAQETGESESVICMDLMLLIILIKIY